MDAGKFYKEHLDNGVISVGVLAGFIAYSQLPCGVIFHANGALFLKTMATYDGEHFLSFSLQDGNVLDIKPDDMVRIFAGSLEITPSFVSEAESGV